MKYKFLVTETFSKVIEVEADSFDDAQELAYEQAGEMSLSNDYGMDKEIRFEGDVEKWNH